MAVLAEQLSKVVEKTERLIELCAALQEENDLMKLENQSLKVAISVSKEKNKDNYAVKDKQDLLSMCVLHYATSALKAEKRVVVEDTEVADKVYQLDNLLTEFFLKQ